VWQLKMCLVEVIGIVEWSALGMFGGFVDVASLWICERGLGFSGWCDYGSWFNVVV